MSTINSFGVNLTTVVPDRGIRRRGVKSGFPIPIQDLDAYVKELVSRNAAEVQLSSLRTLTLTYSATARFAPSFTPAAIVVVYPSSGLAVHKSLWGDTLHSTAAVLVGCTRVQALRSSHLLYTASNVYRSTNACATKSAAWTRYFVDVCELPSGRVVTVDTLGVVRSYTSLTTAASDTSAVVGPTLEGADLETLRFAGGDTRVCIAYASTGMTNPLVNYASADGGLTWQTHTLEEEGDGYLGGVQYTQGLFWACCRNALGNRAWQHSYDGLTWTEPAEADTGTSSSLRWFAAGALLFQEHTDGYLYYSRDAVTWYACWKINAFIDVGTPQPVGDRLVFDVNGLGFKMTGLLA